MGENKKNVFLFPGNGIHQKSMLRILSQAHPFFEKRLKELEACARQFCEIPLLEEEKEDEIINQIRVFASEVAISEFWEKAGCCADYSIGHSLGEYAAAVFCGILTEADAIYLLSERGKHIHEETPHATAISETSAEDILELAASCGITLELSACNAPEIVTVCGKTEDIARMVQICKTKKIRFGVINKFHGAHYSGLRQDAEKFAAITQTVSFHTPVKTMIQTIYPKDDTITPSDSRYWSEHLCNSVQFRDALLQLPKNASYRLLDMGISPVLLGPAQKTLGTEHCVYIPTVRAGRNYKQQIQNAVQLLAESGVTMHTHFLQENETEE